MNNYKSNKTIGIIDSGLGGYTYYSFLRKQFPEVSFTFCADQAYVPFGNKTYEELMMITIKLVTWLQDQGATSILVACNTICSTVLPEIKLKFPNIKFGSVIDFTVQSIPEGIKELAVIGTKATIESQVYGELLKGDVNRNVICIATPWLVDAIESRMDEDDIALRLAQLRETLKATSHLVLACTHYPIIKDIIEEVLEVVTIDGIEASKQWVLDLEDLPYGESKVYTSGSKIVLREQVYDLFREIVEVNDDDFEL